MIDRIGSREFPRALRDFGLALRGRPFRAAFALSAILHLGLFVALRWEIAGQGGDKSVALMRVRLLERNLAEAAPVVAAAAAAGPKLRAALEERPAQQRFSPPPAGLPAAAGLGAETPPAALEAPAPPPEARRPARDDGVAPAQPLTEAPPGRDPETRVAEAPVLSPGEPARTGAPGAESATALPSSPADSNAVGVHDGPDSAGRPGGQPAAGDVVADDAPAAGAVGPHDLAAVRRRIDARKVYPRIAVRNGWEGRVLVEMQLEGDGNLAAVRLLQGSGYTVLDEATITAVRRASPFPPVARVLTVPVEYRLLP